MDKTHSGHPFTEQIELNDAAHLFLDQYKTSTRKAYASCLNPLIERIGARMPVDEINHIDMLRYTNAIRQSPHYSPATVRKHLKSLKTFFYWMVRMGMTPASPLQEIKGVSINNYKGMNKAMSDEQLDQLLAFMDKNQIRYTRHRALVLTLADSGCRIGELAALRWPDVDYKAGTIHIKGKGDKHRPAFFYAVTAFALRDWYASQKRTDGDFVFSHTGAPIASASLQGMFRKVCISAGIGSHGPHKLRHRKAHQLIKAGVNTVTAATFIGDSVAVFEEHYAPKDYASAREAGKLVAHRPHADDKVIETARFTQGKSG